MNSGRHAAQNREASLRRVAIVLSSLPKPVAARLLSGVDEEKRKQLRHAMTSLADVDPLERKRAMQSFSGTILQRVRIPEASPQSDPPGRSGATERSFDDEDERGIDEGSDRAMSPQHPLAFLAKVPDRQLTEILGSEHPQIGAVVLASIRPEKAASLLPAFSPDHRKELIRRIGRLGDIEPGMLDDVAETLKARCLQIELPTRSSSGANALREIMSRMSVPETDEHRSERHQTATVADQVFGDTFDVTRREEPDRHDPSTPSVAEQNRDEPYREPSAIRTDEMSTDEVNGRLESMSPIELCRCLGLVETRDALLTLCGVTMKAADRAIAMLPRAQQKQTRKALAELGPLQLSEIDRAKERVVRAAAKPTSVPLAA